MKELRSIEERILDRALYLFGKNGSTNVPVRAIVKEAEVNVSAINYYFGNKEKMLSCVKQFYIENITQAYSPLYDDNLGNEDKLIMCANEIIEYSLRYPGVLVMNKEASNAEEKDDMDINILKTSAESNKKLDDVLRDILNCTNEEFKYKKTIFMSSIIYPFLNESQELFYEGISDTKELRIKYIKYIVNMLKENK